MTIFKIKNTIGCRIFILLFLIPVLSKAQQEPTFTQYNFNTQTINPAYAGTWDNLGFLVLGRHQWVGMEGAPRTYTLSIQSPTKFPNVGVGLNIVSDVAGFEKRLFVNLDYSYRLQVTDETSLRLGIKGGITSYRNNFSDYTGYPGDPPDPVFESDIESKLMPNVGIGFFLYNEDFYIGLSSPKILKNEIQTNYSNYSSSAELRHFFLIGGYVFDLSEMVKFKPTFLASSVWGASTIVDLTASFLLDEKVWLGANYRTGDSFGFIAHWIFDNQFRIGYAVDFSTTSLRSFGSGSHEVMVSYEFGSRRRWSSPRMF